MWTVTTQILKYIIESSITENGVGLNMANLERNCKLAQQNNGELDASIDNPIQGFDPIDEAMSMDITCVKDVFPLHDIYEL
eukprot:SAG31_NODE_7243_length_1745_cov_1.367558_3_plen_80_part_01